ncbi:MAG TPA: class I SAM-dependent methyltransferase [Acidimicrobiia bacterium]|nr:class I SAM-dependent methyltransferase [Acidimicrobiia bacterium]
MPPTAPLYDELGRSYSSTRQEDPRIAAQLLAALGAGRSVVNVGAGTGSYEPTDRTVVAVEPSTAMIGQRRGRTRRVVRGVAEALPFPDRAFDGALAVFTVHHWQDRVAGVRELRRVAARQVVLFYEPLTVHEFWILDYFPEARDLPSEKNAPSEEFLRSELDVREVQPVLVPRDCVDGFAAAHWSRPEAYLDPHVQAGMSVLALLPADVRARGTVRLAGDLESGEWHRRFGHLLGQMEYDAGYRIAIADG